MVLSRIVAFKAHNVFTNLAAEERLFQRTKGRSLLFYVNTASVVIGRTQNPFNEVDVAHAAQHGIPIVRRRSGGGTVVHDEGNLNVCFISPRDEHNACTNAKLLASVLQEEFGLPATVNARGDIVVGGFKVSGSAYRLSRDRAYHHATLLVRSDLPMLRRLLQSPTRDNISASGTASVRTSVANLAECGDGKIDIPSLMNAVAERWQPKGHARVQELSAASVERELAGLQDERAALSSHAWVYGQTPRFEYRLEGDGAVATLHMKKGAIVEGVEVVAPPSADAGKMGDMLNQLLIGVPFSGPSLSQALEKGDSPDLQGLKLAVLNLPPRYWQNEVLEHEEDMN